MDVTKKGGASGLPKELGYYTCPRQDLLMEGLTVPPHSPWPLGLTEDSAQGRCARKEPMA